MAKVLSGVTLLMVASLLAGCLGGSDDAVPPVEQEDWARCEHPWPCGDGSEWPTDLAGPFERLPPEPAEIVAHDGVVLYGHIWRPAVPEGVKVPVVIHSSPYFAGVIATVGGIPPNPDYDFDPSTSHPAWLDYSIMGTMLENGTAILLVNVRGTGESGGCLDWWGPNEQRDQATLVEWAAAQPWSNGRIGMWGLSYTGGTPWEAAIQAPPALKTIMVGGIITDAYTLGYSPQGSGMGGYAAFVASRGSQIGLPATNNPDERKVPSALRTVPGRACEDLPFTYTRQAGTVFMDDRRPAYFAERRLTDRFDQITSSVLLIHGQEEYGAHRYQEDVIWDLLPNAPKRALLGQWGHTYDIDEDLASHPDAPTFEALTMAWSEFWLKGIGTPPALGIVDHQARGGAWHRSTAWPPVEARSEALYLDGAALSTTPGAGSAGFHAMGMETMLASDRHGCDLPPLMHEHRVLYATRPLVENVTIAGNPYAVLQVEADRPGGQFILELHALDGTDPCVAGSQSLYDPTFIAQGAVDLRFHAGSLTGKDFPMGTPQTVRVDLWSASHTIPAGHRLVLIAAAPWDQEGQPWMPTITLQAQAGDATSHVVIPVIEGTMGGSAPVTAAPPRPFLPPWAGGA